MSSKDLRIDQLKLDTQNPRIGIAASQHEAMQQIIDDQDQKLANLAEDILDNGSLNPMDRLLVIKDTDGKFTVLEENRRTLALKILANPTVLTGLNVRPSLQKRLEGLAARFDKASIEPVACFEVATRADGSTWIRQRHTGENDGRGVVSWSAEATARFTGRDPALQALEFVRLHANLSDDQQKVIASKFPLTTLDRLLSTPAVRRMIGVEIQGGELFATVPADEVIKPLRKIVLDLADKVTNVSSLKLVQQQTDYISKFGVADTPDLTKKLVSQQPVQGIDRSHFRPSAPTAKPKSVPKVQRIAERLTLVPRTCRLTVTNNNTLEIYKELLSLKLRDFPNAIAVLLRVFMENSVDHYLGKNGIPVKAKPAKGDRMVYKTLGAKVGEVIQHVVANGADEKDFEGVTRALSNANHPLSIDLQHAYVHNRYVTPSERDLVVAWDNAQVLFEAIWP